ncbi:hypothetical protein R6Q57_022270 [Mikania cordata]
MVLQAERYNGGYQQQNYSAYQGSNGGYNAYKRVTEYSTPYTGSFQVSTYPLNHGPHNQSGWSSGGDHYGAANHHLGGGTGVPVKPNVSTYENSYYDNSYPHGNSNHHESPLHQSNGGYENSHGSYNQSHGNSHCQDHGGSDHQGYGSPHKQSHSNPHQQGYGNPNQGHNNPHQHQGYGSLSKQGHNSPKHQDYGSTHNQGYNNPHQQHLGSPHGDQGHESHDGFGKTSGFGGGVYTHQINKLTHGHNNNTYGTYGPNPSGYDKPYWIVKGLDDDDE